MEEFENVVIIIMMRFSFLLWFFLFDFQQIVDQIDEESDRCDKEEEEGDREVSEERHR